MSSPRFLVGARRLSVSGLYASPLLLAAYAGVVLTGHMSWWSLLLLMLAILPTLVVSGTSMRLAYLVRQRCTNLCLHCGYAMRGLPEQHSCPECGAHHDRHEAEALLAEYLRRRP